MGIIQGDTAKLKQMNLQLIRKVLKESTKETKVTLSEKTGLSVATVGNLLRDLLESGEVLEAGFEDASVGRPSQQYRYYEDYYSILCVYLLVVEGENQMHYQVRNAVDTVIYEDVLIEPRLCLQTLHRTMEGMLEKFSNLKAVGIGVPGVVKDHVVLQCDIPAFDGVDFTKEISQRYSLPVWAENDMNASVLGYATAGGRSKEHIIGYLFYPANIGPGCGWMVHGQILRGATQYAGEIAALPTYRKENRGSVEGIAETIVTLTALMNPHEIIVTGELVEKSMTAPIVEQCAQSIPREHLPTLVYQEDYRVHYRLGLSALTHNLLLYPYKIIDQQQWI